MMKANRLSDEIQDPCNVPAEAALLGAMMIENKIIDYVADRLSPSDFYEPIHGTIFETICQETAAGNSVSPVTLRPYFETDRVMKDVGGVGYLVKLTSDSSGLIGFREMANQIRDLAKLRTLAELGRTMTQQACDTSTEINPFVVVDTVDAALTDLMQRANTTQSLLLPQAFDQMLATQAEELAGGVSNTFTVADFDTLTRALGKLRLKHLTVLAGRPGMGKSAVALKAAKSAAVAGVGTAFISLEMSADDIVARSMADDCFEQEPEMTLDFIDNGQFAPYQMELLRRKRAEQDQLPLMIHDVSGLKIGHLAMTIRRFKRQFKARGHDLKLVIVDHLGLVKPDKPKNRYEDVGLISRTLKEVAKECNIHMIALCQLNRQVEQREDKRPQLSDLRDSGDIEQDADNVVFVYRHEYYLEKTEFPQQNDRYYEHQAELARCRHQLELIVRKRRQGKATNQTCYFYAANQAIRDHECHPGEML